MNLYNYEIHVTVKYPDSDEKVNEFKEYCQQHNSNYILIEGFCLLDLMTGIKLQSCGPEIPLALMKQISKELTALGFTVVREKLESDTTVPEAASPSYSQYFETHIDVATTPTTLAQLKKLAAVGKYSISRNLVKEQSGDNTVYIVTVRYYQTTIEIFNSVVSVLKSLLTWNGFEISSNTDIEFALYDSNPSHDDNWLSAVNR